MFAQNKKRVALDGTTPFSKPDMALGSLLSVALSSIPEKQYHDTSYLYTCQ